MNTTPKKSRLSAGIGLHSIFTEKFKTNRISVNFVFPFIPEDAPYYAILPELWKHGCRLYPSTQALARRLEELYAASLDVRIRRFGDTEVLSMSLEVLRNRYTEKNEDLLSEAVALLHEMLANPLTDDSGKNFPASILKREKDNLLTLSRSYYNNKIRYAQDRCRSILCEGEAYAVPDEGREEDIAGMELSRVYGFYQRLIAEAAVEIFFIGDENEETLRPRLLPLLAFLGERAPKKKTKEAMPKLREARDIIEEDDTVQAKLCMGYRILELTEEDNRFLPMFNAVLSGSPVSKFFKNVREKKSLCYYCSCSLRKLGHHAVAFVNSGIQSEKKDDAVAAIEEQFELIRQGDISESEMEYARKCLIDAYTALSDTASAIEGFCLVFIIENREDTIDMIIENTKKATKKDLSRIAEKCFLDTVFLLKPKAGTEESEEDELEDEPVSK